MDTSYYRHTSTGTVWYDPGKGERFFEPWWALLRCDEGIIDFYSWLLLKHGVEIERGSRWGSHISFVKGEPGINWQYCDGKQLKFHYSNIIRRDNGRHAWLDCWCPELHEIRSELGLAKKSNMNFHLTLGRLR